MGTVNLKFINAKKNSEKMSEIVGESFDDLTDDAIGSLKKKGNIVNSLTIASFINRCKIS